MIPSHWYSSFSPDSLPLELHDFSVLSVPHMRIETFRIFIQIVTAFLPPSFCNFKILLLNMGKATRWLRSLLGMKKNKQVNVEKVSNHGEKREKKKRWSFPKSGNDSGGAKQIPENIPAANDNNTAWLRCYITETEKEQNDHAIAVAEASAAAADAAIVAAQAAVAVVRLTSQGRGAALFAGSRVKRATAAAVKIQTVFRGYLARKALRALKGLVKLQALVRGFLVRKRAVHTLHSMQALIRAQASIRAKRASRYTNGDYRSQHEIQARNSTDSKFTSKRLPCYDDSPKIVEIDPGRPSSRSHRITPCIPSEHDCSYHCYNAISSPLPCPIPARLSIPECRPADWGFEDYKFLTAHNTPRFDCLVPATPTKSSCRDHCYRPPYTNVNHPGYMADTQSFKAKLRSQSAPKQRPEWSPKKRVSLSEIIMASRSSLSGVPMQAGSDKFQC